MSASFVLLQLAGNVALLLWGVHMVQTGILRAFGGSLRHLLTTGLQNRWKALLAGTTITAIVQSSTATALMAGSFAAAGLMELVPALAVLLGANIGSTLIVQLASLSVSAFAPVIVLAGVVAFRHAPQTRWRDLGRVGIGLGLILIAVHAIVTVIAPVEHADALRQLIRILAGDPVMNLIIGALMAWITYSSVATVLLVMALGTAHVVPAIGMYSLVLGANLGIVIPQYLGAGASPVARRLALANAVIRGAGCLAALPFLTEISALMASIDAEPARQAANFHTLFNLALAIAFIPLLGPLARLCERLLPENPVAAERGSPLYLSLPGPKEALTQSPSVAIAAAQREVLRIVDLIKEMLQAFSAGLKGDDRKKLAEVAKLDDAIDGLHSAVKSHIVELSAKSLDKADLRRCSEVLLFAINLEHVGDILDMSLRQLAARKIKNRLRFSREGNMELEAMQERVLHQLSVAVSVFLTRSERDARLLLDEKVLMRDTAQRVLDDHLLQLRDGRPVTIETSALYVDMIRDLKRITAHLASVAYPVLEELGALRRSRLIEESAAPTGKFN